MRTAGLCLMILAMVGLMALVGTDRAEAYTVAGWGKGGFADFTKAIVFDTSTYSTCPTNAETVATNGGAKSCAIPMIPVGDGSWTCTAVMFPGTTYSYSFEYRIPLFDSTTVYTDSQKTYVWRNLAATGGRNQDPAKTVTVPAAASEGYVFYHIFGDKTVTGAQGIAKTGSWDTELTVANPYVALYKGSTVVSTTGNSDTTDMEGSSGSTNNYSMTVTQTSDTTVKLSWKVQITGSDDYVPLVEGAREFDTQSTFAPYGFRVLRARLPSGWSSDTSNPKNLKFEDTIVNQVTGDTLYSPSRNTLGISWYDNATTFTDTSLPANTAVGDSYIYTVLWTNAYGQSNDTSDQNFSGGAGQFVRRLGAEMIFLVEKFDPKVVFPDGRTEGDLYITPYVNGIPMPFHKIKTRAFIATPKRSAQG